MRNLLGGLEAGGTPVRVVLWLGVLGLLATLLCLIGLSPRRRGRGTFFTGAYSLVLGALIVGFGAFSALGAVDALTPIVRDRRLALPIVAPSPEGFDAATVRARAGIAAGGLPFVAGFVALVVGVRRRRADLIAPVVEAPDDDLEVASPRSSWGDLMSTPPDEPRDVEPPSDPVPLRVRSGSSGIFAAILLVLLALAAGAAAAVVVTGLRPPPEAKTEGAAPRLARS